MSSLLSTTHFTVEGDPMLVCPCCGSGSPSVGLLIVLELVRVHFQKPVTINSCARCPEHNSKVGGSSRSEHLVTHEQPYADAADIRVADVTPMAVLMFLKATPFANLLGLALYREDKFVHVDVRGYGARWVGK